MHIERLTRDRRRYALSTLLGDLAAEPSGIGPTAQQALAVLIANGVAETGLIALANEDSEEEMRSVATQSYPAGWETNARPRALPARTADVETGRDQDQHPWVVPIVANLGEHPWVARIPLRSGSVPIGLLVLAGRRRGVLDDQTLLVRLGAQLATAFDHAAMYEASYARETSLASLDRQRRDFIAALAHEIRTPLSSIQAFAELLQLQPASMDETAEQLVSSLNQGVQRLKLLINDLLDLGQSESVGFAVSPVTVELAPLFAEIEGLLRPAYLLSEQSFAVEIGDGAALVLADKQRLEQVLFNLVSNANRYTPFAGAVLVRTIATENGVRIEVDDSGEGIPSELRECIFDPYYRVDRDDAMVHGSGLGLAVARQLIELQSGRIWDEESSSGGARFCIELPQSPSSSPSRVSETRAD